MSLVDKLRSLTLIVKQNGGVWRSLQALYRTDELKDGELVGVDRNGNKYYQNKRYFVGRSRWVIYNPKYGLDYDGSQIDPQWHPWIHYMTDVPPTINKPVDYKWIDPKPIDNRTGTPDQYVPFPTTQPKLEPWVPKGAQPPK